MCVGLGMWWLHCAERLRRRGWRVMLGDSGVHICLSVSGAPSEKIIHSMETGLSLLLYLLLSLCHTSSSENYVMTHFGLMVIIVFLVFAF